MPGKTGGDHNSPSLGHEQMRDQFPRLPALVMCEGCAGPADELDHRLAINIARALGPEALRRAFTLESLQWLCSSCHRRKTRMDRRLARFLAACRMNWRRAPSALRLNRVWADVFLVPMGMVDAGDSAAAHRDIRTAA